MKALILRHTLGTPPGTATDWLEAHRIPYQILFAPEAKEWPSPESFQALIICGGGMNVDQEDKYPWLKLEKELIRKSIEQKKFVVGLCLGSQLIAEALGAKVYPHSHWEAGWFPVQLSNGQSLTAFQWHGYTFDLPAGAQLLATSSQCKHQAYTYQDHVIAFQFHPEATPQWVIERTKDKKIERDGFFQEPSEIIAGIEKYQKLQQEWFFGQLDSVFKMSAGEATKPGEAGSSPHGISSFSSTVRQL